MKNKSWLLLLCAFLAGAVISSAFFVVSQRRALRTTYLNWQKLNVILNEVEKQYVDTINRESLTDAAISAALEALDPHSVYMLPRDLADADESLAGGFSGIGITFNVPNDTAVVLNVIPGGPSQKVGIIAGDRLIKVNERVIAGNKTPQDTMVHLMRGTNGSKVKITIDRSGEQIPFNIVRDKIAENSIQAAFMVDDTTAYVQLSKFTRNTYNDFMTAVKPLVGRGMTRLLFDLRGNTGGYFDQACNLANEFLDKNSLIVYMYGLHRKRENVFADGNGTLKNVSLKVLIDDASASASEIFAGAIQDNDRGVIVGRRSFGKGLVQEPMYFTDGSGIRLTVARFYTPSGRCIQKPYDEDLYSYTYYDRYRSGELVSADSIKVDSSKVYKTVGGRTVYGGGGIIPDIFVPVDTTRANDFHIALNRKALSVRFATKYFDMHRSSVIPFDEFGPLSAYIENSTIEKDFLQFAASQGVIPKTGEWEQSRPYVLPQIKGLFGRYSKVGEEAYFRYVIPIDAVITAALDD